MSDVVDADITKRVLYRRLGTWHTAGHPGAGRLAQPVEVNGLQAHAMIRHATAPEIALTKSVHDLAVEHSFPHDHFTMKSGPR